MERILCWQGDVPDEFHHKEMSWNEWGETSRAEKRKDNPFLLGQGK